MDKVGEKSILDFVADRRFQVIPLHYAMPDGTCTCGRSDCKHPGKHPREADWTNKGRPVHEAVAYFRDRYGFRNNVGVLTGPVSGILVIDVDPRSGGLRDKLIAELPGILAWAVRGGLLWQKEGLIPPAAVSRLSGGDGCFGCFP